MKSPPLTRITCYNHPKTTVVLITYLSQKFDNEASYVEKVSPRKFKLLQRSLFVASYDWQFFILLNLTDHGPIFLCLPIESNGNTNEKNKNNLQKSFTVKLYCNSWTHIKLRLKFHLFKWGEHVCEKHNEDNE